MKFSETTDQFEDLSRDILEFDNAENLFNSAISKRISDICHDLQLVLRSVFDTPLKIFPKIFGFGFSTSFGFEALGFGFGALDFDFNKNSRVFGCTSRRKMGMISS
jgi:hypothetical protein